MKPAKEVAAGMKFGREERKKNHVGIFGCLYRLTLWVFTVYRPLCRHDEFNNLNRFLAIKTNQVQHESSTKLFLLSNDPRFYDS